MSETVRSEVHWKPQDRLLQLRGMTLEGLALDVDLVTEPNVNVMQGLPVWNKHLWLDYFLLPEFKLHVYVGNHSVF